MSTFSICGTTPGANCLKSTKVRIRKKHR
jgi:hypothetical protein